MLDMHVVVHLSLTYKFVTKSVVHCTAAHIEYENIKNNFRKKLTSQCTQRHGASKSIPAPGRHVLVLYLSDGNFQINAFCCMMITC